MQIDIHSRIAMHIIESYRSAIYQVSSGSDIFIFHIDQYSKQLSQLLAASNPSCAAFITAFNPFSQCKTYEENSAYNAQLHSRLSQYTHQIMDGSSSDPSGHCPTEGSFLAFGINLTMAVELGKQFDQNAIVWIDSDAIPRLILLR